jgi:hypothetical protein
MTGQLPRAGQKTIPLAEWKRFVRVADWWDRTYGFTSGVIAVVFGFDILVKTPSGGIPARSGTTIYGVECIVCAEAEGSAAGEKLIIETSDRRMVYNIYPETVTEEVYVPTGLTWKGTRYVTGEPCI